MSKYTPTSSVTVDFDGDKVQFEIRRITYADAIAMRDMDGVQASKLASEHVNKMTGLFDATGKEIPMATVVSEFYFSPLILDLTRAVLATGTIPQVDDLPFGEK